MTWVKVILMAVISAVITAVFSLIPLFDKTSFQDIAINPDCWFLFAIFIIINCNKWQEAAVKTFVFFLISQPLIYLIQVPFNSDGFGIFRYYKYWFIITLLTIPGALIAFLLKKKNILSAFILSVATGYLGYAVAMYFWNVKANFPHHLLSMVFCFALSIFLSFALLNKNLHRIISLIVFGTVFVSSLFILKPANKQQIELPEGNWNYSIDNDYVVEINMENNIAYVTAQNDGYATIAFTGEDGTLLEYSLTVGNGEIYINKIE